MTKERQLKLLPNLQFIYELRMAQLEASALIDGAAVADDFRSFLKWKTDVNQNFNA